MKSVLFEFVCLILFTCVELRKHHNHHHLQQPYHQHRAVSLAPKQVHLRHSRYPNLEQVYSRLNLMASSSTERPAAAAAAATTTTSAMMLDALKTTKQPLIAAANSRRAMEASLDDEWDDQYDDLDNNNDDEEEQEQEGDGEDVPDYYGWDEEDDNENRNYYDDKLASDDENYEDEKDRKRWQAEEATEIAPSSLTEYKWQHYGTRTRVEESRRNQNSLERSKSYAESAAALQHTIRINREGRCKEPAPKIVSVQSVHPDPGKIYIPHCTILYRCAEDTGCCSNHATKCGPKKLTNVHLYFYATTLSKQQNKVEKLEFVNHTECGCLENALLDVLPENVSDASRLNVDPFREASAASAAAAAAAPFQPLPETIRKCKCPEEYTPHIRKHSHCWCDCTEGNLDCSLIKKGKEFFSLKDRLCILNGHCGLPNCEFGAYMRNIGRCPRKQEKLDAFANVRN